MRVAAVLWLKVFEQVHGIEIYGFMSQLGPICAADY